MNVWAKAQKTLINANENTELELPLEIFSNNTTIPIILTENDSVKNTVNIDEEIAGDKETLDKFPIRLKNDNDQIEIEYMPGKIQYLY